MERLALDKEKRPVKVRHLQRGFILIYVIGMLAAATALIVHAMQIRSSTPRQIEHSIQQALQTHEIDNVIDFLLLVSTTVLPVDPRYARYQDILRKRSLEDVEKTDELALLKAMLAEVGFKIDLSKEKSSTKAAGGFNDSAGRPLFPLTPGTHNLKLGETRYQITVESGNRRPDLNAIPFDRLWRVLKILGKEEQAARQLAANIIDWRDPDNLKTEGMGRESEYYQSLSPGYVTPDRPIRTWQELSYVDGIDPGTLNLLRDNFTLGPGNSYAIQFAAVTPLMLVALLDISPERAISFHRALRQAEMESGSDSTQDPRERVIAQLSDSEQQLFRAGINWGQDNSALRVVIRGSDSSRVLDYDTVSHTPIARW